MASSNRSVADRFTDTVFSWSVGDIFNEDLFKTKVEKIPETFQSDTQYFTSFINPLLEEIRAELHTSMEFLNRSPYAEIKYLREEKHRGPRKSKGQKEYRIEVDYWRNNSNNGDQKESYKTLPGDLFVVARGEPERASDLQKPGNPWAFFSIFDIKGDGDTKDFKVKASKNFEPGTPMFVVFLTNLIPAKRIWEALHMHKNLDLVNKALQFHSVGNRHCEGCSNLYESTDGDLVKKLSSSLNESQARAVLSCLHLLKCEKNPAFELIWGPPGTGKTKTISSLLVALLARNCKILVCAPTNVAITEVASRVVKLVSEERSGSPFFSLGDILLVGTKERLNVGSGLEVVYLDHRMEKLADCFGPFNSMIDLLQNCVSQFRGQAETGSNPNHSFLEYFRKRFDVVFTNLRHCVNIICTHVPEAYITRNNVQHIEHVMRLFSDFRSSLLQHGLVSESLEKAFSPSEDTGAFSSDENFLSSKKNECLFVLIPVRDCLIRLGLSGLKSEKIVEKFCYQRASLVFCTVSCSSKLHKKRFKPTILVIDEAAQLKESESTIPLQLAGIKHAILVGDECQLPATVKSKVSMNAEFGRSLFKRLSLQNHPKHLLSVQYRMDPRISSFPNSEFYRNQIRDAEIVKQRMYTNYKYLPGRMFGPYSFINITGGRDETEKDGHSKMNNIEVAVIAKIVQNLYESWRKLKRHLSVGIVSPYAAQVRAIHNKLKRFDNLKEFQVKVKTVDGFQGGEEDIIIVSTVCSGQCRSIDFISMPQRVNVAITRGRENLWILGDERTLSKRASVWRNIVLDAKNRKCFFDAKDNKELDKAITDAKKEFGHFDDLLKADPSLHLKSPKWKVYLTNEFLRSVEVLSAGEKMKVKDLLIKLSDGERPGRIIVECQGRSRMEIASFKVIGRCAVTTVDILQTGSGYVQVLRIWALLSHPNISQLAEKLDFIFGNYTDQHMNLCNEKPGLQGKLELPMSWSTSTEIARSKDSENPLGMKFYAMSNCVLNHMLSNREAREMDLLSQIPDQQKEVILFQRSAFILGRSGTGKSSVMIMKLFQNEYLHGRNVDGLHALENSGFDPGQTAEKEPLHANGKVLRQLFVTSDPRQCNLTKRHLSSLRQSGYLSVSNPCEDDEIDCEETDFPSGISPNFYPLIITFRQFLLMLEGSLGKSFSGSSKPKEVDWKRFSSQYWPLFDPRLAKKLEPSTVFTEIMCHIKGGTRSIEACNGKISREEYVTSTKESGLGLSRKRRERIYDIFRAYEETKTKNGEFDMADLVNDLHARLKRESYKGEAMDFVYVDDVQSLTMTQFALFAHVCKNVETGFFFSGDTLKDNASGGAFRIQDMRSVFHKSQPTSVFNLTQNFRAHPGVLKLSQSIVELLYHFFPLSIDIVEPETTSNTGDPPLLLLTQNHQDFLAKLFGDNSSGFGAEQVIMVRDECERMKIKDRIGNRALVLTMAECQDLEFEDVLLYNFFGSSPLKKQWGVIYKYMKDHGSFDPSVHRSPELDFDDSKYNMLLLSELKQLYIAVSRTTQRLWVWDDDELSKPMFECWKANSLVRACKLNDSLAREMKISSSSKQWKSRGIKLYHNRNYEMAAMCFEKARDSVWETKCRAFSLVVKTDTLGSSNPEEANSLLSRAAEMYNDIDEAESAAKCFELLGEYEKAGKIYAESSGVSELQKAGECFALSGHYNMAAEVYAKANLFSKCLDVCVERKLFEVGLEYLQKWNKQSPRKKIEEEEMKRTKQEFLETCAVHYHKVNDRKSMMKVVENFVSTDLTRNFLKSNGYLDELASFEEKMGNFVGAVEIARLKGDHLLVADLLGKDRKFEEASAVILSHVIADSLWSSGKKGWPLVIFENKNSLLSKATSFATRMPQDIFKAFQLEVGVLQNNSRGLSNLAYGFDACLRSKSCITGEIVSSWRIVDVHLDSNPATYLSGETFVISNGRVSVASLVDFWNTWKNSIVEVLVYLKGIERGISFIGKHGEFCMRFLGVWRQIEGSGHIYTLLNSDASWARNVDKKPVQSSTNLFCLDSCRFAYAAQSYWSTEVIRVGFLVLHKLFEIYANMKQKVELVYEKCRVLVFAHDIAKILSGSDLLRRTCEESEGLERLITLSIDEFFDSVCPSDRRKDLMESIALFRETAYCRDFLKRVVIEYCDPKNGVPRGNIETIAMIILGSRKLSDEMYEKVLERTEGQKNPPWNAFFAALSESKGSRIPSRDLVLTCHEALSSSFEARFDGVRKECISPECFVYLLERLLIWASSLRGYFVTSRSSFVEWLVHQDIGLTPNPNAEIETQVPLTDVLHFVIDVLQQCLRDKAQMIKWIERSGKKKADEFYSPLAARMVVIMCLLHANFGMCSSFLRELLGKHSISEILPLEFCDAIESRLHCFDQDVLAEAFQKLGDPLVVVILGKNWLKKSLPGGIVVDMNVEGCKTEILRKLFSRKSDSFDSAELIKFWLVYEDLKFGAEVSYFTKIRKIAAKTMEIQKHIKMLTDATRLSNIDHEVTSLMSEISDMVDDMKRLDAALTSMSESTAQELSEKWQLRRPRMDSVVKKLLHQHNHNEKPGCQIQ